MKSFSFYGKQAIVRIEGNVPKTAEELIRTSLFKEVVWKFFDRLLENKSTFLGIFPGNLPEENKKKELLWLLQQLSSKTKEQIIKEHPEKRIYFSNPYMLHQLVENLYNFWRGFERFLVCYSCEDAENSFHSKPYRTFNHTIEALNDLVRAVYRDICENITGTHPRIYRQMPAGFEVGLIAMKPSLSAIPKAYQFLNEIHLIRQVLIEPPLIFDPPMNKRSGQFKEAEKNPLDGMQIEPEKWLCYPARVGPLMINLYFHNKFIGLGTALSNLFELADDGDIEKKPDAIYMFGVPEKHLAKIQKHRTIFYNDKKNDLMVAAVPDSDEFGYFGYVKKMMLTLHNIIMMKRGRLPVHGAMVRILLKSGKEANIVLFGDSGAGKSESLEAFRMLAKEHLREMVIIFDDMGSLEIKDGKVKAYGTEIGAFVRLDDLQPGFAFGNIDRSIIMSPHKINARAVLPITTLQEVLHGYKVDFFLYANNYEEIDKEHPIFEEIKDVEKALKIFGEGARMAKGTTSEKGLVHTYFANIFGPAQHKELHEPLAKKYFEAMEKAHVAIGVFRTRLGIEGYETKGPLEAAKAIMEIISKNKNL